MKYRHQRILIALALFAFMILLLFAQSATNAQTFATSTPTRAIDFYTPAPTAQHHYLPQVMR